jgi:hypothetical protein
MLNASNSFWFAVRCGRSGLQRHTPFLTRLLTFKLSGLLLLVSGAATSLASETGITNSAARSPSVPAAAMLSRYCEDCHDGDVKKGGLDLESLSQNPVTENAEIWEKVIRKLHTRQMPPIGKKRPDESTYNSAVAQLAAVLDTNAEAHPNPGRTDTFRRLTRIEYQNAIRDLLGVDIDAAALLPKDESSRGFDNITVGDLSPTLLDRYISAAQKISRLAIGSVQHPGGDTFRIRPDLTQEEHVEGLPLGTRGGEVISYTFPNDAEYEVRVRLSRDRNEEVEGLHEPHELQMLLDGTLLKSFAVAPPADRNFELVDQHLHLRFPVKAGVHKLGITFVKNPSELLGTKRQPYHAHYNLHRHPRLSPAIYQVSINGPYDGKVPSDTPSRCRIFTSKPERSGQEEGCAKKILLNLARRAWRRPVTEGDIEKPLKFYRQASADGGFEADIEMGLSAILVSPEFLFRVETDPPNMPPKTAYKISDVELANRLSFFLWSSIPDDELLAAAAQGELSHPDVLEREVRRMLADQRSHSLVSNFADQWFYLRNLESITPDLRLFPDFDDNLRRAFRQEAELLFDSIVREDRNVLDLIRPGYTFLNQRLAEHYGIPHIYGSRFRRVSLGPKSERGGLLRLGSTLTVTSYATRTSPVVRGNWILSNLLGTPTPPPPPNTPPLKENTLSSTLSVRERLTEHRARSSCAVCHNLMDPIGFSLENFDAIGRWRTMEDDKPVDATGGFPDGSKFCGVDGLEKALLKRPEIFVGTMTEKLMTFALGRGMEPYDGPAIRKIVREAEASDFRFSSIIMAIVKSTPFTMRTSQ